MIKAATPGCVILFRSLYQHRADDTEGASSSASSWVE